jgi:hypothetical protein
LFSFKLLLSLAVEILLARYDAQPNLYPELAGTKGATTDTFHPIVPIRMATRKDERCFGFRLLSQKGGICRLTSFAGQFCLQLLFSCLFSAKEGFCERAEDYGFHTGRG